MLLWTILKVGFKSLLSNAMRSILAMLGIIIGVGAVISMLALGSGFQKKMMEGFAAMGTNLMVIQPGQRGMMGVTSGVVQTLTIEDAQAILKEIPGIEQASPMASRRMQVKYASQNFPVQIMGGSSRYFPIRNFQIGSGRSFTDHEVDGHARIAVLGATTATNLFGLNDPVGETIKVNGINFKVVGVAKPKGNQGWFDPDDVVIVPYTTALKQLLGLTYLPEIDIQVKPDADTMQVQDDLTALLRKRHKLQGGAPDDFNIRNQADMIQTANDQLSRFRWLLGGVATISLLVGGIGIMNIMLVTVTERTREIGIRKAIGAKRRHILVQFLLESIIISGLGGLLGAALGIVGSGLVPFLTNGDLPSQVEPFGVLLALSFSGFVGIFFGFYPAWRASGLDPVEALRYE